MGEILLEKVERLDFFLVMQDVDRSAYVLRALQSLCKDGLVT